MESRACWGSTPAPRGPEHILVLETASSDVAAQPMLVVQRGFLCLFNSRNPALRNGTEPHTRDKLIQQQWHETVLFFILLLLSPHEAASLNSYFIYYWLPRMIIYKGGLQRKRQGKVDSDSRNAPHVKTTAAKQKHQPAHVLQPQRIQF